MDRFYRRVSELTLHDLARMDAGSWMAPRFMGQRVPMLWEALLAIGPHAVPVIELKEAIPPELLMRALRKYDLESDAMIPSGCWRMCGIWICRKGLAISRPKSYP